MSILNITGTKIKNKLNIYLLRLIGDKSKCILCGQCANVCKFDVIKRVYARKILKPLILDQLIKVKY